MIAVSHHPTCACRFRGDVANVDRQVESKPGIFLCSRIRQCDLAEGFPALKNHAPHSRGYIDPISSSTVCHVFAYGHDDLRKRR